MRVVHRVTVMSAGVVGVQLPLVKSHGLIRRPRPGTVQNCTWELQAEIWCVPAWYKKYTTELRAAMRICRGTVHLCTTNLHAEMRYVPARYACVPRIYKRQCNLYRQGTNLHLGFTVRRAICTSSERRPLYYYLIDSEVQNYCCTALGLQRHDRILVRLLAGSPRMALQNFSPLFGRPAVPPASSVKKAAQITAASFVVWIR